MKKTLVGLLVLALASTPTWADPGPDQKRIESVRKKVDESVDKLRRIVVETYDGRRLQGFRQRGRATEFTLSYSGRSTTLSYADVKKIKWESPVMKQVKVMVAAAVIVGATVGLVVLLGGLKG